MRRPLTVVMQRAHRRAALLDKTLRFYEGLNTSAAPVEICVMVDRPTPDVQDVLRVHEHGIARKIECPFPVLSFDGGQRFMESSNHHLAAGVEPLEPQFVIFSDDDRWPEPSYQTEHREIVQRDDVDCWYARSLFFWDEYRTRIDFFDHNSIFLWRHTPGDRFDTRNYNQAPARVHEQAHRHGRTRQLEARLLDYGYATDEERRACFKAHAETGRLDAVTLHLMDPNPILRPYAPK